MSAPIAGRSKMLPGQFEFLAAAVRPGSRVLEVGTLHGATAARLADAHPDAEILSLDIFRQLGPDGWVANRRPNMTLFVGTLQEFDALAGPALFDVILVDADHRYEGCRADLFTARRLLAIDGRLFAHDYGEEPDWKWPGVTRAVKEYCAATGCRILGRAGSLVEIGGAP